MSVFTMPDGKDPDEILDYAIDLSRELVGRAGSVSDIIVGAVWTLADGISESSSSFTTDVATIWLEGGTVGNTYEVSAEITTLNGRLYKRSFLVQIITK